MRQETIAGVCIALVMFVGIATALTAPTPTSGDVPVADGDAPSVVITGGQDIEMDGFGPDSSKTTVNATNGNISVSGPDDANVTADNIEGTYTRLSGIDTASGVMRINPGDKSSIRAGGDVDSLDYRNPGLDDGTDDFRYSASGGANITVRGLSAGASTGAINASSGELLDSGVVQNDGSVTYDQLPSGNYDVRLQEAPQDLEIRNETSPGDLIPPSGSANSVEVEITFFPQGSTGTSDTITRTTTDGTVSMANLPNNESFIVEASADGYAARQIYVSNLYEQNKVYLLADSEPQTSKTFRYTDYSGRFPQEDTILTLQRPINGNWTTISGDVIGATGEYDVTLETNQRHRLVVLNQETGERRVQGPITPETTVTQEIEVYSNNEIDISGIGAVTNFAPSTNSVRETSVTFETDLIRRDAAINNATVTVYRKTNGQLTQLQQSTTNGPGTVTQTANLSGYNNSQAVVEAKVNFTGGDTQTVYRNYSINRLYGNTNSLISVMGAFSSALPTDTVNAFETTTALLVSLLLSAAATSRARLTGEGFGVVMVAAMAAFSIIGWVSYGIVFAAGVGMGALVILRRGF